MPLKFSPKHLNWVRRTATNRMKVLGHGYLGDLLTIEFRNDENYKNIFAEAGIAQDMHSEITINARAWQRLSYHQRLELIDHEICHIVTQWAGREYDDPHRGHWANLMRELGRRPRRFLPWKCV